MEIIATAPTLPIKLCYYITGHGYGHATRSLKVVEVLFAQGDFDIHIVSTAPTIAFLNSTLSPALLANITTHERMLDTGKLIR
jgi:predicted glycosyltransferase